MDRSKVVTATGCAGVALLALVAVAQTQQPSPAPGQSAPARDAVADFQTPRQVGEERPEQKKTEHDRSGVFKPDAAPPSSTALEKQPEEGKIKGFDFSRDPLNAKKPGQTFEEIMAQDVADKPKVMEAHRKLLESRYELTPKLDPEAKFNHAFL